MVCTYEEDNIDVFLKSAPPANIIITVKSTGNNNIRAKEHFMNDKGMFKL